MLNDIHILLYGKFKSMTLRAGKLVCTPQSYFFFSFFLTIFVVFNDSKINSWIELRICEEEFKLSDLKLLWLHHTPGLLQCL